jgi:hypothetical protein
VSRVPTRQRPDPDEGDRVVVDVRFGDGEEELLSIGSRPAPTGRPTPLPGWLRSILGGVAYPRRIRAEAAARLGQLGRAVAGRRAAQVAAVALVGALIAVAETTPWTQPVHGTGEPLPSVSAPAPALSLPQLVVIASRRDMVTILTGPLCLAAAACESSELSAATAEPELASFTRVGTFSAGAITRGAQPFFETIAVATTGSVFIHLALERSDKPIPAPDPENSTDASVTMSAIRGGWSLGVTLTGKTDQELPYDEARNWVLTSPLPD